MVGAPEVIQFNQNLMRLIGAKRVLDLGRPTIKNKFTLINTLGLFTGISALGGFIRDSKL